MSSKPYASDGEIRIGISACLLGDEVRFDGGHKHDRFLTGTVGEFVSFTPVCPEVELGLGIPRETIRLERGEAGDVRLVGNKTRKDITEEMERYAEARVAEIEALNLCGYILKKDSPSCGAFRVRVYEPSGMPSREGRGLFAEALIRRMPLLPVEEEGRLQDPMLRENFFERVFAYRRLKDLFQDGSWSMGDLVRFHTREKLFLLSHDTEIYRELGRLVAGAKKRPREEVEREYGEGFMRALGTKATVKRHVNVLQHMAGHFRDVASVEERDELGELIEDYRQRLVPLIVPITLLKHLTKMHRVEYLAGQTYLEPNPRELMLRNHC
ncbi:MAG: DUF523 and DUF1722 domain-containing protein [Planctomycetota bacterium]